MYEERVRLKNIKETCFIKIKYVKEDFDKSYKSVKLLCHNHLNRGNMSKDLLLFMACFGKGTITAVDKELGAFMDGYIENIEENGKERFSGKKVLHSMLKVIKIAV